MKWYQKSWVIVLFIIFVFPVGLFLMWKYTNWNKILKVVVTCIIAFVLIGNYGSSDNKAEVSKVVDNEMETTTEKPTQEETEATTVVETTTAGEITTAEEVIQVTAQDLLETYKSNEIKGDELYKDKRLQVTGTIANIGKDLLDKPYVSINSGEQFEVYSVQCFFKDKDEIAKLGDLNKGDEITITGTNSGYTLNILLKDCKLN